MPTSWCISTGHTVKSQVSQLPYTGIWQIVFIHTHTHIHTSLGTTTRAEETGQVLLLFFFFLYCFVLELSKTSACCSPCTDWQYFTCDEKTDIQRTIHGWLPSGLAIKRLDGLHIWTKISPWIGLTGKCSVDPPSQAVEMFPFSIFVLTTVTDLSAVCCPDSDDDVHSFMSVFPCWQWLG